MSFNVVILTGKPGSMKQAENFLRNRKWNIFSTATLRDCIAAVVKMRPDFVLIPADHPNKKVRALPKLLGQAIQVKVIAFVEATNGVSMGALNEMKMEYNLYPPVSGPAIERMCLKIRKEEEDIRNGVVKQRDVKAAPPSAAEQLQNRVVSSPTPSRFRTGTTPETGKTLDDFENFLDEAATPKGSEVYVARGGSGAGGPGIIQPGSGAGNRHSGVAGGQGADDDFDLEGQLAALMREQSGTPGTTTAPSNTAYMPTQENNSSTSSNGYVPKKKHYSELDVGDDQKSNEKARPTYEAPDFKEREKENSSFDVGDLAKRNSENSTTPSVPTKPGSPDSAIPTPENTDPYAADWRTDEDGSSRPTDTAGADSERGQPRGKAAYMPGENGQRPEQKAPVMEREHVPEKAKEAPRFNQDAKKPAEQESIFIRGTQQALDEASRIADPKGEYKAVEGASQVACLTVKSQKFSGYLVAAMGKNQKIDKKFMETVRDKLFDFLRSHGEAIQNDAPMELNLQEVQFEDWALAQAEFLRKSVHGSNEVAMAFFPSAETTARLEASVTDSMLKMNLDELKDNVPVEFDLFIYMPTNNRFLLYTPQGRPIYGEQRGRLREKGVTHIHLRADAAGQVKKYRAQVFLNDKIAELKNKRRKAA